MTQTATDEEQMIYDAFYEYARYMYSNWKLMLKRDPQFTDESGKRAFVTALAIMEAENAGLPQDRIYAVQEEGKRRAMLDVSESGGPFRVRYVIIRSKSGDPKDYEVVTGHGDPSPSQISGLVKDTLQIDARGLYLNIYRESIYPKEDVQVFAISLDDEGQLA